MEVLIITIVALFLAIGSFYIGKRWNLARTKNSISYWAGKCDKQTSELKELNDKYVKTYKVAFDCASELEELKNQYQTNVEYHTARYDSLQSKFDKQWIELNELKEQVEWLDFLERPKKTESAQELRASATKKATQETLKILNEFDVRSISEDIHSHYRRKFIALLTDLFFRLYQLYQLTSIENEVNGVTVEDEIKLLRKLQADTTRPFMESEFNRLKYLTNKVK